MKKYLFLSSAFLMTMAGANAADKIITSANTCTVDVLGVSDNNAIANTIATWDLIDYTLDPGEYLNVTDTSVTETTCPAGSYCVGGGFTVETANNSIAQCPTEYPNSATGAGAQNQCYTACTVATANIAHATAVSGNDYYGSGVDTCGATACETGYHVDGGGLELVEKTPLIPVDYTLAGNGYQFISQNGIVDSNDTAVGLSAKNTYAVDYGYGRVYGRASCQPSADPAFVYIINNIEAVASGSKTMEELRTELTTQYGQAKVNSLIDALEIEMSGGEGKTEAELFEALAKFYVVYSESSDKNYTTDSTGQYCYCQMDGFSPITDGVLGEKNTVVSAPWVFFSGLDSADGCAANCASDCATNLQDDGVGGRAIRAAAFGALGYTESVGICTANTINIDWNPDNGGDHIKNMCTYDGSITVPSDPVKPGYTFTGWKLLEENK